MGVEKPASSTLGVSLMAMRDPEVAQARVPVT